MNWFLWLIAAGVVILIALGLWSKIYTWIKGAGAAVGVTVPASLDATLTQWLTTAKSAKVQGLLRLARIEFKVQGDDGSLKAIDGLIAKAATWDDEKSVEPIVAVVSDSTAAAIEKLTAQLAAQSAEIAALKQAGA